MTTIINLKNEKCDVIIDRTSPFGNPFKIGVDGDRQQVIEKYRKYFYNKLKDDEFRGKVEKLKGLRLGCWCKPHRCHGDVIVEYLEGISYERDRNTKTIDIETFS